MNKRHVVMMAAAVLVLWCGMAYAQERKGFAIQVIGIDEQGWKYGFITGITGYPPDHMMDNLKIPQLINGMRVLGINGDAFRKRGITVLDLGDDLAVIGAGAFAENNLTGVSVNADEIYPLAFADNKITRIELGGKVENIWGGAFLGNPVTAIVIGANVEIGRLGTNGDTIDLSGIYSGGDYVDAFGFSGSASFFEYYNRNGKKAGTYTWDGARWNRRP
ncbi:MAG: leucine-rich repeat domain-containing protein [Treponema sp.]|jgi:hypothetical protein|nr:leucine-rich repeat domain-containing protein [Treponema sp.]